MNEVIEMPEQATASSALEVRQQGAIAGTTPADLLRIAMTSGSGLDMDRMERLMAMQERWEANEAKKRFNEAFSAFKAEAVRVVKDKLITDGPLKGKKHADLFSVVGGVTPMLSKHGLSASWSLTKDDKDWIEVTCKISHVAGHSESVPMGGPPDTGPGRNAIQARVSSKSYLERTTLMAALGLAAQDEDDDGAGGAQSADPAGDRLALWTGKAAMTTDLAALRKLTGEAAKAFSAARDKDGYAAFGAAAQRRAAVLKGEGEHVA